MSFLGIVMVLALLGVIESANRASRYRSEAVVLNKRVSLAGRCVIDVSWMARRRELPIRAPVRFERTVFGEHLHLRASDLFLPGPWMDSGTQAAFEIRERFKAQVIARAASGGNSDHA